MGSVSLRVLCPCRGSAQQGHCLPPHDCWGKPWNLLPCVSCPQSLSPPFSSYTLEVTSGSHILASGQRWSPSAAGRPWTISTAPQARRGRPGWALAPGCLCGGCAQSLRIDRGGGWCLGRLGRTEEALLGEAGTRVLVPTEVGGISELTEACDWWSFGSLLYELLTGMVSGWAGCSALVGATECGMGQA